VAGVPPTLPSSYPFSGLPASVSLCVTTTPGGACRGVVSFLSNSSLEICGGPTFLTFPFGVTIIGQIITSFDAGAFQLNSPF